MCASLFSKTSAENSFGFDKYLPTYAQDTYTEMHVGPRVECTLVHQN
jgi:hypothetical protein